MGHVQNVTSANPTLTEFVRAIHPPIPGLTAGKLAQAIQARGRPSLKDGRIVGDKQAFAEAYFAAQAVRLAEELTPQALRVLRFYRLWQADAPDVEPHRVRGRVLKLCQQELRSAGYIDYEDRDVVGTSTLTVKGCTAPT